MKTLKVSWDLNLETGIASHPPHFIGQKPQDQPRFQGRENRLSLFEQKDQGHMVKDVAIWKKWKIKVTNAICHILLCAFFFNYVPFDLESWVYIPFPFQFKVSVSAQNTQ